MKDALLGLLVASLTGLLLVGSCGLMGNGEETWDGVGVAGFTGISGLDWLQIRGGPEREENRLYMENLNMSVSYQGKSHIHLQEFCAILLRIPHRELPITKREEMSPLLGISQRMTYP